jgi:hypothetical protein
MNILDLNFPQLPKCTISRTAANVTPYRARLRDFKRGSEKPEDTLVHWFEKEAQNFVSRHRLTHGAVIESLRSFAGAIQPVFPDYCHSQRWKRLTALGNSLEIASYWSDQNLKVIPTWILPDDDGDFECPHQDAELTSLQIKCPLKLVKYLHSVSD